MLEAEGSRYWESWQAMGQTLLEQGMIADADENLYMITTSVDAAVEEITRFFSVYHSQRYVDDLLILRLNMPVPEETLAALTEEFSDILRSGTIFSSPATEAETATNDNVDLPRIALDFNRRSFGRLRALIDRLNDIAG
jgi:hypothetical protein